MRQMRIQIGSHLLYESFFDPKTGNLIRRVAPWEELTTYGSGDFELEFVTNPMFRSDEYN